MAITPLMAMVRKDLQIFFSDRRSVIVSFVVPIAIAAFFGSIFAGSLLLLGPEKIDPKNAAIAIGTTKLTITDRRSLKKSCRSLRTIATSGMTAINRASSFRSA